MEGCSVCEGCILYTWCAVLLCLVCLFDLACFFLSSHLSLKYDIVYFFLPFGSMHIIMYVNVMHYVTSAAVCIATCIMYIMLHIIMYVNVMHYVTSVDVCIAMYVHVRIPFPCMLTHSGSSSYRA